MKLFDDVETETTAAEPQVIATVQPTAAPVASAQNATLDAAMIGRAAEKAADEARNS